MLPERLCAGSWDIVIDTSSPLIPPGREPVTGGKSCAVKNRSLVLLQQRGQEQSELSRIKKTFK